MKELLLMRHAKAEQDSFDGEDRSRPLAPRGERNATAMGKCLGLAELVPERILCSPAARALQTAELVAGACGFQGQVEPLDAVYGASAETMLGLLRNLKGPLRRMLLVGHNPGLEHLLWSLVAPPPPLRAGAGLRLATGAMVLIELPPDLWQDVAPGQGVLEWLLPPRLALAIQPKL